jgi:hypothetical protein
MSPLVLLVLSSCPVAADPVPVDVPPSQITQGSSSGSGRSGLLDRIRSRRLQRISNRGSRISNRGSPAATGGTAAGVPGPIDGRLAPVPTGNGTRPVSYPPPAARPVPTGGPDLQ